MNIRGGLSMSVLIKGIEMPKNCIVCPLIDGEYGGCLVDGKSHGDPNTPDNCPLIPVSPHGRLIDADALLTSKSVGTQIAGWGKMYHEACIEHAPTIIPADESDMDSFIRIFKEDDEEDGMDSLIRILKD